MRENKTTARGQAAHRHLPALPAGARLLEVVVDTTNPFGQDLDLRRAAAEAGPAAGRDAVLLHAALLCTEHP